MRTSIVSFGLASAAYAKLALKENTHVLTAIEGEGEYFGEDSMDWWVGAYSYEMTFEFGVKTNDNTSDIDGNVAYLNAPAGLWLKLTLWDENTWFDFITYNVDEDFLIGEVAFLAKLWGPIAPIVDFDHDGDDADYYTSTDTNIDEFCVRFGYKLNLLVNTYTSYSNAKTCRKSWMKLIANDFKMDDKVCAFSYDTEGAIEDDFLSIDFWEHLIVDTLDGDQTEFDDLFGTQWFGDSDMCTDFAEDWFF